MKNDEDMLSLIKTSIQVGTKFTVRWSDLMCKLALQAVRTVSQDDAGVKTVDLKRNARVEKVPGGEIEQSTVLSGVMLNKDVTHPKYAEGSRNPVSSSSTTRSNTRRVKVRPISRFLRKQIGIGCWGSKRSRSRQCARSC